MGFLDSSSTPYKPNIDPQIAIAGQSANTQRDQVDSNFKALQGLNPDYLKGIQSTGADYQNQSRAAGQKFLSDIGTSGDQLGQSLSDALTRRSFANQPALANQLREQMAAGGGLARGAYDQGVMQQNQQLAGNLFNGQQDLINQQLQARQNAMGQVYGNDQSVAGSVYGNDLGGQNSVFNASRSNLNDQNANQLGIQQNLTNSVLGLKGYQDQANLAANSAQNQNQSALLGSLLAAGGTAAGAYFGGPVGAAAGNRLGTALATSTGPRGNVQSA